MIDKLILPEDRIQGHVKVELIDDRTGKVVQVEEGDNFISVNTIEAMKSLLRYQWIAYHPVTLSAGASAAASYDSKERNAWSFNPVPNWHIAYWNDATAEDSANEKSIAKEVLGFASRWNQGSPTGKRGTVVTTAGSASHDSVTWVYEWPSANGNGTFQSVGFCNMNATSGAPCAWFLDPMETLLTLGATGSGYTATPFRGLCYDGTGWVIGTVNQTSNLYELWRYHVSTGVGTLLGSIPNTAAAYSSNVASAHNLYDVCKIGTDWYTTAYSAASSGSNKIAKLNSSFVQQWMVQHDGGASEIAAARWIVGICTDGSNLYVGSTNTSNTTPLVHQISTTTGLITATITPGSTMTPFGVYLNGIGHDGTNFWMIYNGGVVVCMDSSGNLVDNGQAYYGVTGDSGTATSPGSGTFATPGGWQNQPHVLYFNVGSTSNAMGQMTLSSAQPGRTIGGLATASGGAGGGIYGGGIDFVSGSPYIHINDHYVSVTSVTKSYVQKLGKRTLGSRVLLDNPVTKTSSHALRISYTVTF